MVIFPKQEFFRMSHQYKFQALLVHSLCKILQKFLEPVQRYEMGHFWVQIGLFTPNNFWGEKSLILSSSTYWPISLCKILKSSYSRPKVTRMRHFWKKKWVHLPKQTSFRKPFDKPSSCNSCPSAFQKSDINLLMKYWWLKKLSHFVP